MKKTILKTALLGSLMVSAANADIARVELGGGIWQQTPNGTITYTDGSATGTYTSDKKEDNGAYAWLLIKHPIPIIPNLRLEYADIKDKGVVTGDFKDFTVPGATTTARFEMKQYDIIPYYNILDNTMWTTIDLGIDVKVVDATYEADNVTVGGVPTSNYTDSDTVAIPLVYARARVEIPATNIGLEADGKYITYDGSTVYDFRAKVDYTFDFVPVVQPAIEVGYRVQKFDVKSDDDKTKLNIDFSGVYAGLMLRF
ncbi:TIGR04219 family outer membrane beta-barrel protein [Sulfurimonas paralvinellae]|uniref:TIGR04219 family outer membrane beta-barrel protein n=1 Tax=Sulfurimonas paralvinellae TaxID=317658 RepID=A0A7M1B5R6_9BACT|nr:TIGR04219 family outer membrane beta-barrel protein [Sulfurimonas paralvinellae]QOP44856.1 TIGR04219 family outer membrane beta-barrel protein [Sulfurimonas paralvinellae]